MTNKEAIEIIRKEYLCVDRDCDIDKSCGKCDLMMPSKEPILEAYKVAIKALEQEPCEDAVSRQWLMRKATERFYITNYFNHITKMIEEAPSVKPLEPKTVKVIKMRDATPEERESVDEYVKSISKPTGVNFWTLSQESCNNVISREEALQALCKAVHKNDNTIPCSNQRISCLWNKTKVQDYAEEILKLQPIKLQQKIGYWVRHNTSSNMYYYDCSLCGCVAPCTETADSYLWKLSNYCPDCGAKMIEPQERKKYDI